MTLFNKKNLFLGLVAILALSVPLTVTILQRQQDNRSKAAAATTLAFTPATTASSPLQKKVGDTVSLDLMVTPGTNLVSFIKFKLNYDQTKLQPVSPDPFTLNTVAFQSKDGPVINSGSLTASVSVGSDPTKAIQKLTKVGSIQFKIIGATGNTPTSITFDTTTQALSVGNNEQGSENVISSTLPVHIATTGQSTCDPNAPMNFTANMTGAQEVPTSTSSGTGTVTITGSTANNLTLTMGITGFPLNQITDVHIHSPADPGQNAPATVTILSNLSGSFTSPYNKANLAIPEQVLADMRAGKAYVNVHTTQRPNGEIRGQLACSNSTQPSGTPAPTGTGTPLSFDLLLHGVGSAGDNPNPRGSDLSNKNPLHPQRNLHVELYDTENKLVTTASGALSLNYDEGSGSFVGNLDLGPGIKEGNYNLKVKTDRYLRKRIPGIIQIKPRSETNVPKIDLVAGDVNSDNVLNVVDYNAFLDCGYGELEPLPLADPNAVYNTKECQAHTPPELVDIDDNGTINSFDYNLFLRELSVQNGD